MTRHSAVLGSTGSGKSTTVASLLRALTAPHSGEASYPNARILLLDIHGEYSRSLSDVSQSYRINAGGNHETNLCIPFWALESSQIINLLFGSVNETQRAAINDMIAALKENSLKDRAYEGVEEANLTVDSPIPFSLKELWYRLIDPELRTFKDNQRQNPALQDKGNADLLIAPTYDPATTMNTAPFMNTAALGLKRQLAKMRSHLLDHRYDFLLRPGEWEPDLSGHTERDLDGILRDWVGHELPITILDLSGVPSDILGDLIGSILKIIYEGLFWGQRGVVSQVWWEFEGGVVSG